MPADQIRRLPVWGRYLRLTHWLITICILVLLATGWLLTIDPTIAVAMRDYHYFFSSILIAAFAVRIYLLFFGRGTDLATSLKPDRHSLRQAWAVLKFYISLGKFPLPRWYAHNPLWGPLYLVVFVFLALQIISGLLLLNDTTILAGISVRNLHHLGNQFIAGFTLLHVLAVFSHDLKGSGSDISAMINGHRIFPIETQQTSESATPQVVALDDLLKNIPGKDN